MMVGGFICAVAGGGGAGWLGVWEGRLLFVFA